MKKKDLVKAAKKGYPNAEAMVNNVLRAISSALVTGEKVTVYNFGEFYVRDSKVTHIYDFQNKKMVPFEGSKIIGFKACPAITKMLNNKENK
jgi:DNA-binding protein HU-beta